MSVESLQEVNHEPHRHFIQNVGLDVLQGNPLEPGEPCIVFMGATEHIYLPVKLLPWLEAQIRILVQAHEAKTGLKVGRVEYAHTSTPQTWRTAQTDDGKIAIVIDHELPTQQSFAMTQQIAAELGARLIEKSAVAIPLLSKH